MFSALNFNYLIFQEKNRQRVKYGFILIHK